MTNNRLTVLLVLFSSVAVNSLDNVVRFERQYEDARPLNATKISTTQAATELQCARQCKDMYECGSFNVDREEPRNCELLERTGLLEFTEAPGTENFKKGIN